MIASHSCGTSWHQRGDRTGHCSSCHRTFASLDAFDRHQRVDGRLTCLDPATLTRRDGSPLYEAHHDGLTDVWSIRPTAAQRAALNRLIRRSK